MGVGLPSIFAVGSRGRFGGVNSMAAPTLEVEDDGDGSVTIDVTNNQDAGGSDQVSRLKYKLASTATWTVHGTTFDGDQADYAGLTGLSYQPATLYDFILQPYDSLSGAEGPVSNWVQVLMQDSSLVVTTSEHDDELTDVVDDLMEQYGRTVTFTPWGGSPAQKTAIVQEEGTAFLEEPDEDVLWYRGTIRLAKTDVTAPDRRDSFTVDGVEYPVKDIANEGAGTIVYRYERKVTTRQSAGPTRGGG